MVEKEEIIIKLKSEIVLLQERLDSNKDDFDKKFKI